MPKTYIDNKGLHVFTSQGIGDNQWGAFRRKTNGSLQRIRQVDMFEARSDAEAALLDYAAKKNWKRAKKPDVGARPIEPARTLTNTPANETELIDADNAAQREADREREVALAPFTESLPYKRDRLVGECKLLKEQMALTGFELGKRLVAIRENEPHGDWCGIVEDEIGISQSWAWRLMTVAQRFATAPKLRDGIKSVHKLLAINVSDREIAEAEKTGTVLGREIDEIDRMTEKEVRSLARSHNKRFDDAKKQVDDLRAKNADLESQVEELKAGPRTDDEINKLVNKTQKDITGLFARLEITDLSNVSPLTRRRFVELVNGIFGQADALAEEIRSKWADDTVIDLDDEIIQVTSGANHPTNSQGGK